MTRRFIRPWLCAAPLGLLTAATASASSITTYGSIVLSTLGTEGMTTTVADASLAQPAATTVSDAAGTVNSGAPVVNNLAPIMNGSGTSRSGGGSGGGGSSRSSVPTGAQGVTDPAPAEVVDDTVPPIEVMPPSADDVTGDPGIPTPREDIPTPPIDTVPPTDPVVDPMPPVDPVGEVVTVSDDLSAETGTARTPEPATMTLLGIAGIGSLVYGRRRRK